MLAFRSELKLGDAPFRINHKHKLFFTGSCFSQNIGEKLQESKFCTLINPFGVLFNPVSVFQSIEQICTKKQFTETDILFRNNLWFSYDFHSSFSNTQQEQAIHRMNISCTKANEHIASSNYIFITLGTSYVYYLKQTQKAVANCHKQPAKEFSKTRLSLAEAIETLNLLITTISQINQSAHIIFTVSPIRHWKDGAHENNLSKGTLLLAIDECITMNPNRCSYFPAYELIMDDLRDYRFYDADLMHPNKLAIDYIWEKFGSYYFNAETLRLNDKLAKIRHACMHRPFNPDTDQHKSFLQSTLNKVKTLAKQHPQLCFEEEIRYFSEIKS